MPSETFDIIYASNPAAAIAGTRALVAEMRRLDHLLDQIRPKLQSLGTGVSRGLTSGTRAAGSLTTSLDNLSVSAAGAHTSMSGLIGATNGLSNPLRTANTSAGSLRSTLMGFGGTAATLAMVRAANEGIADALQRARDFARETAEENLKLRDSLRELRALKGGTTDEAVSEVIGLMAATGAKEGEAIDFDKAFEGSIATAKKGGHLKLNDKEIEGLKVQALRFAIASGVRPETMAKAVSNMGVHEDITSVDQALGKLGAINKVIADAPDDAEGLYRVLVKTGGMMIRPGGGGAVKSSEEMAAIIAGMDTDMGKAAATTQAVNQVWRELSNPNNKEKAKTFARLGITPGKDEFADVVEKIAPLVLDAQKPGGPGALAALHGAGFRNQAANMKIIDAVENRKILRENLDAIKVAGDPAAVKRNLDKFDQENPDRRARAADAQADKARGEEMRDLISMRRFASAGLKKMHLQDSPLANFFENVMDAKLPFVGSIAQGVLGQDPARLKVQDAKVSAAILQAVPDAKERFPGLKGDLDFNPLGDQPLRGDQLARVIRQLKPEEREAVVRRLKDFSEKAAVPAGRLGATAPGAQGDGGPNGAPPLIQAAGELKQAAGALNRVAGALGQNANGAGVPAGRPAGAPPAGGRVMVGNVGGPVMPHRGGG